MNTCGLTSDKSGPHFFVKRKNCNLNSVQHAFFEAKVSRNIGNGFNMHYDSTLAKCGEAESEKRL